MWKSRFSTLKKCELRMKIKMLLSFVLHKEKTKNVWNNENKIPVKILESLTWKLGPISK